MGHSVELKPNHPFLPQLITAMLTLDNPTCAWSLWKPGEGIRLSELELQMVVGSHWVLWTQSGPSEVHTIFLAAEPPP